MYDRKSFTEEYFSLFPVLSPNIKVKENHRGNQEWTILEHRQQKETESKTQEQKKNTEN